MTTLQATRSVVKPAVAGNPRDAWPAWTDDDRWELGPEADPSPAPKADEEGPRPTAGPDFEPTSLDDSERLGFDLGLEREGAFPPGWMGPCEARRFVGGWIAGRLEWDRRLDVMFGGAPAEARSTDLEGHPRGAR